LAFEIYFQKVEKQEKHFFLTLFYDGQIKEINMGDLDMLSKTISSSVSRLGETMRNSEKHRKNFRLLFDFRFAANMQLSKIAIVT
jgi:hypothetical protein